MRRYNQEDVEHTLKGAQRGAEANKRKRGTTKSDQSYTYVKENQVHQHRVVAERVLGRPLRSGEVVHHEDLDKKNNDISNLIVFPSNGAHMYHHYRCITKNEPCRCDCVRLHLIGGDAQ